MKKFAAAILLLGLSASNGFASEFFPSVSADGQVKERPYKFSLGVGIAPYSPAQGSVSFIYNPNKSIGSFGLLAGRYSSARLEGFDAAVFVGFWSNDNKEKTFGWHGYFGLGMSSAESRNPVWKVENSPVSTKTFGLGVDVFKKLAGNPFALVLEGLVVQRNVVLDSGGVKKVLDKDLFHLDLANDSRLQFGLRIWL